MLTRMSCHIKETIEVETNNVLKAAQDDSVKQVKNPSATYRRNLTTIFNAYAGLVLSVESPHPKEPTSHISSDVSNQRVASIHRSRSRLRSTLGIKN